MKRRVKARKKAQRKIRRKERSEVFTSMLGGLIWFGIFIFMWIMATGEEREESEGAKDAEKNLDVVNIEAYEDDDEEDDD